ncbi:MAG TPA: glycosyltransferase family 39 protein [Candidatus Paceibacterota bacterium]|nr:glycosyltransferase family 39 protein [Candidatus Paceibacterota bacterium]
MVKDFVARYKVEVIIFCIALAARLVLFSIVFAHNDGNLLNSIHGDDGYYELSQGILNGHGMTWDTQPPFAPNPLRPPVWPYLIAFFAGVFKTYWAVFAFELVLGSLIPVLAYRVARMLFGHRIGKWTAIIMCVEPYLMLFSIILYTETCFMFFFLLFLIFLIRYIERPTIRSALYAGLTLGLATMVKPTVQYLPILIPIALAIMWRERLRGPQQGGEGTALAKQCAIFLLMFLVVIAPWLVRNHQAFGVWGMSAQPEFNLYVYLAPTLLAIDNGTDFKTEYAAFVERGGFDPNSITLANADIYKSKGLDVIRDHKLALMKSGLITLVTFFTHDGMLTVLGYSGITIPNVVSKPVIQLASHPIELASVMARYAASPAVLIILLRLFWIAVTISFVYGACRYLRRGDKAAAAIMILIVLYFAGTTAINGFGVNARFRMPVDAIILGFALFGLFSIKRDNTRTEIPAAAR